MEGWGRPEDANALIRSPAEGRVVQGDNEHSTSELQDLPHLATSPHQHTSTAHLQSQQTVALPPTPPFLHLDDETPHTSEDGGGSVIPKSAGNEKSGATATETEAAPAMASVGVFCSLCYAEMANGIELRQHISEKHPNVFELSDEDAAAVRLAVMNASGVRRRLTGRFSVLRNSRRTWVDLSETAMPNATSTLLTNLTAIVYGGPPADSAERRAYERSIVPWQGDGEAGACAVCSQKAFTFGLMGKHHCRLCGFVICAQCSQFLKADNVHIVIESLSQIYRVGIANVVESKSGDCASVSPNGGEVSSPTLIPFGAHKRDATADTPASARSFDEVYAPLISSLRCCTTCRGLIEDAQKAVGEHRRQADLRKRDAMVTTGITAVSAEVSQVFRSLARLLPRYNNLANALWAGEALSQRIDAVKMLGQIEASAGHLEDWTKIAKDSVRFAQREIEARIASAVLARIDSLTMQQKAVALPPKQHTDAAIEARKCQLCTDDLGPDHVIVWENQRRWPGTAYSGACLFTADPDPFTRGGSDSGVATLDEIRPGEALVWEPGSDWLISTQGVSDEDGWQYATSFDRHDQFTETSNFLFHFVRRRIWCRVQVSATRVSSTSPAFSISVNPISTTDSRDASLWEESPELKQSVDVSPSALNHPAPWNKNHDAKVCECCRVSQFSFLERKHHCRHCGRVVCSKCSPHRTFHPWYNGNVRTCDGCLKSISRRQSVEQATERGDLRRHSGVSPLGPSVPVTIFECERWDVDNGWSSDHLREGEWPWQHVGGGEGFGSLDAFETALCGDRKTRLAPPTVAFNTNLEGECCSVAWIDSEWKLGNQSWEYGSGWPSTSGRQSSTEWIKPKDDTESTALESCTDARKMNVRRRIWKRSAQSTVDGVQNPVGTKQARMQSYVLRLITTSNSDNKWQKGWYVLNNDALRGYDSEDYTIVRWRTFVSAFESVRVVHNIENGDPSQVVLTTNVSDDVVFATATPELADSWALAFQDVMAPPLITGQLYHRLRGVKAWDHHYYELRGKDLVYWDRQGDKLRKGTMSLAFTSSIRRSQDAASMHLSLTNRKGQVERHELRAENSKMVEEWILAIGTSLATPDI